MDWVVKAHEELTTKPVPKLTVRYSGRFKGFNANVKYGPNWMEFSLSRNWEQIDEDIKKGLIQHLLQKVYRTSRTTMYIDMYNEFLRQASEYAPRGESDPYLVERYHVLNEEYFHGLLNQPTLQWGSFSTTKLGSYDYGTDVVTISTALQDDEDMLDYVLYHELLHKKHKFACSPGGQTRHHTKEFRADERKFRIPDAEKRLNTFIAGQRRVKRSRQKPVSTPQKTRPLWKFW